MCSSILFVYTKGVFDDVPVLYRGCGRAVVLTDGDSNAMKYLNEASRLLPVA